MIPLIVDLDTEWRGGQNQALLLLKGLYERGHAAELLTAKGSSLGHRAKKAGIYVHEVSRGSFRLAAAQKIRWLMGDGRFDVVHANESHAVTALWLAGAYRKAPFVISRRVGFALNKGWIARKRYDAARIVAANSEWVAEQVVNSGVPREKVRVVYEGVEIPDLLTVKTREAARATFGIGPQDKLIGCVGAVQADKGHEFVIRALGKLRTEFPECKLLIAGKGEYLPQLEALVAELGLQSRVIFPGFLKEIATVYEALDIFVFPSLFEGLGTSLLAAMSYGVPSVTFFGCALGEIVENGKSGIQVEARNVDEIAKAIALLLGNSALAERMGRAGRERIAQKFSADQMVAGMLDIYAVA